MPRPAWGTNYKNRNPGAPRTTCWQLCGCEHVSSGDSVGLCLFGTAELVLLAGRWSGLRLFWVAWLRVDLSSLYCLQKLGKVGREGGA